MSYLQILLCTVFALTSIPSPGVSSKAARNAIIIGGLFLIEATPMANAFFTSGKPLRRLVGQLIPPPVFSATPNSAATVTQGTGDGLTRSVSVIVGSEEELEQIFVQYPHLRGQVIRNSFPEQQNQLSQNFILRLLSGATVLNPVIAVQPNTGSIFSGSPLFKSSLESKILGSSDFGMPQPVRVQNPFPFAQATQNVESSAQGYASSVRRTPMMENAQSQQWSYAQPASPGLKEPKGYGQAPKRENALSPPTEPDQSKGRGQSIPKSYAQPTPLEPEEPKKYGLAPKKGYTSPPSSEPEQSKNYGQPRQNGYFQPAPAESEERKRSGQAPKKGYIPLPPRKPESGGYGQLPQKAYAPPEHEEPKAYGQASKRGYVLPPMPKPTYIHPSQRGYPQPPALESKQLRPYDEPSNNRQSKRRVPGYSQPARPVAQSTGGSSAHPTSASVQVFDPNDQSLTPSQNTSLDTGPETELQTSDNSLMTQDESHVPDGASSLTNEKNFSAISDSPPSSSIDSTVGHADPESFSLPSSSASPSRSSSSASGSAVSADEIQKATSSVTREQNFVNSVLEDVQHNDQMHAMQNNTDYFRGQLPSQLKTATAGSLHQAAGTIPTTSAEPLQQTASAEGSNMVTHVKKVLSVVTNNFADQEASAIMSRSTGNTQDSSAASNAAEALQSTSDNMITIPPRNNVEPVQPLISEDVIRSERPNVSDVSGQVSEQIPISNPWIQLSKLPESHHIPEPVGSVLAQEDGQFAMAHHVPTELSSNIVQGPSIETVPTSNVTQFPVHPETPFAYETTNRPVQSSRAHFPAQPSLARPLLRTTVADHQMPAELPSHAIHETLTKVAPTLNHVSQFRFHPGTRVTSKTVIRPVNGHGPQFPAYRAVQGSSMTHSPPSTTNVNSLSISPSDLAQTPEFFTPFGSSALPPPVNEAPQVLDAQFSLHKPVKFEIDTPNDIAQEIAESIAPSNDISETIPDQYHSMATLFTSNNNVVRPASRLLPQPVLGRRRREVSESSAATPPKEPADVEDDEDDQDNEDYSDADDEDDVDQASDSLDTPVYIGPTEIEEYFGFLRDNDHDDCLKRLVCEVAKDPESYGVVGQQIQEFFLEYQPKDDNDPSNTFRKAATIGRTKDISCPTEYQKCAVPAEEMKQQTLAALVLEQAESVGGAQEQT